MCAGPQDSTAPPPPTTTPSLNNNEELNEFEKQGIQFKVITEDMVPEALDFLWEQFAPQATLMRNLDITRNWLMDEMKFKACMKQKTSIAAIDRQGNIIGIRLGKIVNKKNWVAWLKDKLYTKLVPYLLWALPAGVRNLPIYFKIFNYLEYDVWKMFDQFSCDTIYAANGLCSTRSHGVRGLGTELVRRSEILARDMGCEVAVAIVTGMYSERVFINLDYKVLKELYYQNFRDEKGELYLKDTREHSKCFTCVKVLSSPAPVTKQQQQGEGQEGEGTLLVPA